MLLIKYTKRAEVDLDKIFYNIFQDKQSVAIEYINKMREFIRLLQTNPLLGFDCKKKNINKSCRILVFDNYNIYYTIFHDSIRIAKIVSSKQNTKL